MYIFHFGTIQDIAKGIYRVYCWFGVRHTDDGGKSTLCSGKRTGMNIFCISTSGISEMNMSVDESRSNCKAGQIKDFFTSFRCKIFGNFRDDSVFDTNIHKLVCLSCRINKMSVF